ncbi:MAG: hypothetical protein LAO21_21750 [Acidobacteriia bacterium]|nr:hypothetical protein [Terriglobia bacterium]
MRQEEIKALSVPYSIEDGAEDRFYSSIGADVPSAAKLSNEILGDLDNSSLGISWWGSLPTQERILISDYSYQCATGIEVNLAEAKLHYLEWLDARERDNKRIADVISRDASGQLSCKMPPSRSPLDDLPSRLEAVHVCGFFRAIGSSLDCLGAMMISVLGLSTPLRRTDIGKAENALSRIVDSNTAGSRLQIDFRTFYEQARRLCGVEDWLEWANQYRNMFVHRGRRITYHRIIPREALLLDAKGQIIPRATSTFHLAKCPDRSEIEAFIKSKDILLGEDADITLKGIFKSGRDLQENICERLLSIWCERRKSPAMIEQPIDQWDARIRPCNFDGYEPNSQHHSDTLAVINPVLSRRMRSASVDDAHRNLWVSSPWSQ